MKKIKLIDIGSADFQLDNRWLFLKSEVDPILFEPDPRSFKKLKEKGYNVYNTALGSCNKKANLNLTRKPACSSFLVPNTAFLSSFPNIERWDVVDKIELQITDLDSYSLNPDFIKIDTQGTELDILQGATKTLKNVLGLELEVSFLEIYKNQPLFGDICDFLKLHGFQFFDFVTEYRYGRKELNRKGQLAFADALFLRPPEKLIATKDKIEIYKSIAKAYGKEDLIQTL